MKKFILLLMAFVLLGALVIVFIPFSPAETAQPVVGADRDTHGCIASAGYTYSVIKGTCIRVWEAGTALVPVDTEVDGPVFSAYVVQSENGQEAEVFLPGQQDGVILTRVNKAEIPMWTGRGWELTYDPEDTAQGWKLKNYGLLIYASKAQ